MKKRYIKFSAVYSQKLIDKILDILTRGTLDSYSMLELSKALGKKFKEGSTKWESLKLHLIYMTRKGRIEERHFGTDAHDWNKRVDYVLGEKPRGKTLRLDL